METRNRIDEEEVTIDLGELLLELWRNKLGIILATIFLGLAAVVGTKLFITPQYTSETSLYVLTQQDSSTVTTSDLTAGSQLTSDYAQLVTSRPVLEQTITNAGIDMTTDELAECIAVTTPDNTRMLDISVTYPDPQKSREIADALRDAVGAQIISVMNIDAVNTVEDANLPTEPSSPNVTRNGLIGAILGLLLACGIVVITHMLDDTVKTPEDVDKYLGLTVLGSIPVSAGDGTSRKGRRNKKSAKKRK